MARANEVPEVIDIIREAITSNDPRDVDWAVRQMQSPIAPTSLAGFAPELVKIVGTTTAYSEAERQRRPGEALKNEARTALYRMNRAALSELQKARLTAPEAEQPALRRWCEVLEKQPASLRY